MKPVGVAIGLLLGGVAGLLLAPRRGTETRARLRTAGQDVLESGPAPLQAVARELGLRRQSPASGPLTTCEPTL